VRDDEGKCGPLEQEQPTDVAGCVPARRATGQDEAGQTGRDGEHTGKLDAGQRFADEHGSGDRDQKRRRAAGQRVDLAKLTEPVRAHEQQVLGHVLTGDHDEVARSERQGVVVLEDGAQLWTATSGTGSPVLLCLGGPGLWDYLSDLAVLLEDDHTVVRFE